MYILHYTLYYCILLQYTVLLNTLNMLNTVILSDPSIPDTIMQKIELVRFGGILVKALTHVLLTPSNDGECRYTSFLPFWESAISTHEHGDVPGILGVVNAV